MPIRQRLPRPGESRSDAGGVAELPPHAAPVLLPLLQLDRENWGGSTERAEAWVAEEIGRIDDDGTTRKGGPTRVRVSAPLHPTQFLESCPEVSQNLVESDWKVIGSRGWRRKGEHIVTLEGRAIVLV